jgi:hypothetical protein
MSKNHGGKTEMLKAEMPKLKRRQGFGKRGRASWIKANQSDPSDF